MSMKLRRRKFADAKLARVGSNVNEEIELPKGQEASEVSVQVLTVELKRAKAQSCR